MSDDEDDPVAAFVAAQRRWRRRALVIAGVIAVAAVGLIGALVAAWPGPARLPAIRRPYLWRVTPADGAVAPSYLFGTMHVGYGLYDLPRAVLAAQAEATVTVTESDLLRPASTGAPPPASADALARLSAADWERLARRTGQARSRLEGAPTSELLGALLATALPRVDLMDRGLQARALWRGQRVVHLDDRTLEEVLAGAPRTAGLVVPPPGTVGAVDERGEVSATGERGEVGAIGEGGDHGPGAGENGPGAGEGGAGENGDVAAPAAQPGVGARAAPAAGEPPMPGEAELIGAVRLMLARPGLVRDQVWTIAATYAQGDGEGCGGGDELGGLVARLNEAWSAPIAALVARGGVFVAIGCSHLDGPGSIVERLRAAGHQVERVGP